MKIEEASENLWQNTKPKTLTSSIIEFIYTLAKQNQHTLYLLERRDR